MPSGSELTGQGGGLGSIRMEPGRKSMAPTTFSARVLCARRGVEADRGSHRQVERLGPPWIGTRTTSSHSSRTSAASPHASLPITQACGAGAGRRRAAAWCRPRRRPARGCRPHAASPRSPRRAARSPAGRWNREPAVERTTFGACTSTEASLTSTASAPAASAPRITVPALPGSRTLVSSTSSRGPAASDVLEAWR